jgi:hypothetical protein
MSKQSAASLSVVPVKPLGRIEPPTSLAGEELKLWRAVVDSKPADWFGEDSAPLLTEYVRAVCHSDELDRVIKSMSLDDQEWVTNAKPYMDFMRIRDMEAKRAVSIATKLRLTQQSRYTPQAASTANKKAGQVKPWAS